MNTYLPDEPTKVCLVFSVLNETFIFFVTFVPFIYVLFSHLESPQSDLRFYFL